MSAWSYSFYAIYLSNFALSSAISFSLLFSKSLVYSLCLAFSFSISSWEALPRLALRAVSSSTCEAFNAFIFYSNSSLSYLVASPESFLSLSITTSNSLTTMTYFSISFSWSSACDFFKSMIYYSSSVILFYSSIWMNSLSPFALFLSSLSMRSYFSFYASISLRCLSVKSLCIFSYSCFARVLCDSKDSLTSWSSRRRAWVA